MSPDLGKDDNIVGLSSDDYELIKDTFLDMLMQACGDFGVDGIFKGYDSMCLSAYESALSVAVEMGWIKEEEVLR